MACVHAQLYVWLPENEPLCGKLPLLCFAVVGHRESLFYKNNPEPSEELTQALRCQSARCNNSMFLSPQPAVFDIMVLGHICPSERKRALEAQVLRSMQRKGRAFWGTES